MRFAFDVVVHHDGEGRLTGVEIKNTTAKRALIEKIRIAVTEAVAVAPPAPPGIADPRPFLSRWRFVATWCLRPPVCRLASSDALGAEPGRPTMSCGAEFDVDPHRRDGGEVSSFEVKMKTRVELLEVRALHR